jgi:hypothetical protein
VILSWCWEDVNGKEGVNVLAMAEEMEGFETNDAMK